jgi:integrase
MDWRLYADPAMAPLRRSSGGAIRRSWFGSYGAIRDMRLGELLSADWKYIDFKECTLHIPKTKIGESRTIPLTPRAVQILKGWPRSISGRLFPQWAKADSFEKTWRRALQRARDDYQARCIEENREPNPDFLANLRFHDLRHESTSRFFEFGLNPMEVAAITGHKTLQMLKRYTHLRAEDLAKKLWQGKPSGY